MSFWRSTLRKGRADHRCEVCGRTTPKGEKSYVEAGVVDGDFHSYRQCIPCHDLVARLYASGELEDGWVIYELPEIAKEAGEEWPPVLLSAETPQSIPSEREEVVAWLRAEAPKSSSSSWMCALIFAANYIERGEHLSTRQAPIEGSAK